MFDLMTTVIGVSFTVLALALVVAAASIIVCIATLIKNLCICDDLDGDSDFLPFNKNAHR